MTKNWIAINVVLLIIAVLLGWQLKVSAEKYTVENDLAKVQPVKDAKQKLTQEGSLPPAQQPRRYSIGEFAVIPEKCVFADTRAREEKEVAAPVVYEPPELTQPPILVGVTIAGNQRMASIIDPAIPGSRKTQTKKVGDVYQGYTITDITDSQIVLESGAKRRVLALRDGLKRNPQGGRTPILATRVVAFGGGAAGGSPTLTASGAGSPARPASQPPVPIPGSIGGTTQPVAGRTLGIQPSAAVQAVRPQGGGAANQTTDAQGRTVIRTPFGDIVRDKPPVP